MKIAYLIRTFGHQGLGGHYNSLKVTAETMSEDIECVIINIGKVFSPVIQDSKIKSYFIYSNGYNMLSSIFELNKIILDEKITVLHSFDESAFFFGRMISFKNKLPHLLTKCGGPNYRFYPKTDSLICYSQENFDYYKKSAKFDDTSVYLLPNRVTEFSSDFTLIKKLKEKYIKDSEVVMLRIARISKHYEKGFYQILDLVNELNKYSEVKIKLIFIGAIENYEVYSSLKKRIGNHLIFSDEKYIHNAKKMIDIADIVVASGRGVMEAASKNKILLTTSDNNRYPILISKTNFNNLFALNFSPRIDIQLEDNRIIDEMIYLLNNRDVREKYELYSRQIFDKYFNIESVRQTYINIYNKTVYSNKIYFIDFFEHFVRSIRSLIRGLK